MWLCKGKDQSISNSRGWHSPEQESSDFMFRGEAGHRLLRNPCQRSGGAVGREGYHEGHNQGCNNLVHNPYWGFSHNDIWIVDFDSMLNAGQG